MRAKYAVLTLEDFVKGPHRWFHSYIWGRFAQPSGLVYARNGENAALIQEALTLAVRTFVRRALPQAPEVFTSRELWGTGLSLSYRCELRSEKPAAAVRLFDAAPEYYEAITHEALKATGLAIETLPGDGRSRYRLHIPSWKRRLNTFAWSLRRVQGKGLSALRLLKAILTFENGLDYILVEDRAAFRYSHSSQPRLAPLPPAGCLRDVLEIIQERGVPVGLSRS